MNIRDPQGSKCVGTERIDGSAIDFYGSSFVADATGRKPAEGGHSEGEVHFHLWRLIKGIALATLIGVGTELTFGMIMTKTRSRPNTSSNQGRNGLTAGREKALGVFLQYQAGQVVGHIGAGVDPDPIFTDFGYVGRRVPVNHDLAVVSS